MDAAARCASTSAPHLASARPSPCSTRARRRRTRHRCRRRLRRDPRAAPHRRAGRRVWRSCPGEAVEYRGTVLEEMDVDASSHATLSVALVDELAHTNVPGSRNEKRWQDVEELLDAGIDVISTRQHPAPRIAERRRRARSPASSSARRCPTRSCVAADQVELVDMTPEALRRRMAHGNIYRAEKIDTALANYFRSGNLGALRELALLWVADRVEVGARGVPGAPRDHGTLGDPRAGRRRASPALPSGEALIRARGAHGRRAGGELLGVHVIRRGRARAGRRACSSAPQAVAEMGGEFHEVVGDDPPMRSSSSLDAANGDPARARGESPIAVAPSRPRLGRRPRHPPLRRSTST